MLARNAIFCKWLILNVLICLGYESHSQVKADFTATPTSGCAALVVSFKDISTGNPNSWKWDLGNGTISFLQNPAVTYFTPGQYNVKLIVRNALGADSVVKNKYITVYSNPVVDFLGSPLTGCFPLPATFTDLSMAGSGSITTHEWDFGDGNISGTQNPEHTYSSAGNFNVSLRITNSFGCKVTVTKPQYIKINTGVKASFTNNIPNSCNAPVTINFINTSAGTGVLNYTWDFGDGSGSTLLNPFHTYTVNGSYTVKLIVKNITGCTDTIIKSNLITLGNVHANFSAPLNVCQGSVVNLVNTSSPVPGSATWDFGDGTISDSINPLKIYSTTGNYVIKMLANFGACIDSAFQSVTVMPKPVVDFSADKNASCKTPFMVNFVSNVPGLNSYLWDFGDSTSSTLTNVSHTYTKPGTFDVKLVVTNAAGCSDSLIKTAYIIIQVPKATINNLPVKGCAPFFNSFSSTTNSIDPVVGYQWDFGDGSTSSLPTPG
ncbi:MAG: PKD domain-containing protein, partial [Chitinophagaceae bacterium]|nr:PKD domain-containing protein [Chitinophagaceae bacterium]